MLYGAYEVVRSMLRVRCQHNFDFNLHIASTQTLNIFWYEYKSYTFLIPTVYKAKWAHKTPYHATIITTTSVIYKTYLFVLGTVQKVQHSDRERERRPVAVVYVSSHHSSTNATHALWHTLRFTDYVLKPRLMSA